jgi:hypothetical protein
MNTKTLRSLAHLPPHEALQARLALRLAAGLDEVANSAPHDIEQRLRVAREQALARARERRAAAVPVSVSAGGAAALGGWWMRLAAVLPLVLLVGGLVVISQQAVQEQVDATADVDAALLADDLPPAAYSDPGFLAFLKNPPLAAPTVTQ